MYVCMHSSVPVYVCASVPACAMVEQSATVHLTLSSGEPELELLEGGETGNSSLHISVQRRHQSLAEMSVLQAGDRPLNVSPSQVNTESQPASHRRGGVGGGKSR